MRFRLLIIISLFVVSCDNERVHPHDKGNDSIEDVETRDGFGPVVLEYAPVSLDLFIATITGTVLGAESSVEVGVVYGPDKSLSNGKEKTVSVRSNGEFSLSFSNLVDQQTYYYKLFTIVNGSTYYGKVNSFTTEKLYYQIDGGPKYGMVTVNGGEMQPFSISQTEIPPKAVISVNGREIGTMECNGDDSITLYEAQKFFMNKLNKITGCFFRQPTQKEWQFAASGGKYSKGYQFCGSNDINEVGWYSGNSGGKIHGSGQKSPNELGLYDMSGNYGEVCLENDKDYGDQPWDTDGPICGGSWKDKSSGCTASSTKKSPVEGYVDGSVDVWEQYAFDSRHISFRIVMPRP